MKTVIVSFLLTILLSIPILMVVKGKPGTDGNLLAYQHDKTTEVGGPFESTNSSSRYALVEAIVENRRFDFTLEQARFSAPDLILYNNKFFSIFTPGVSFVAVPFYLLGKLIDAPQLGAYSSTVLFSLINFWLMIAISQKLGVKKSAAITAALLFTFGTNVLVYTLTLTQHISSVTILLLALWNALAERRTLINNVAFGLLYGIGLLLDFPNLFLLFPMGLYVLIRNFPVTQSESHLRLGFQLNVIGLLLGFLPLAAALGWYNYNLTGSPLKSGQTMLRTDYFDTEEQKQRNKEMAENADPYAAKLPFSTRAQLRGMYTLLVSNERAWVYYSPIVLLGIVGMITGYQDRKLRTATVIMISVVITNILLYSMFGDPWGGWTFGPRYLIPACSVMCLFLALAIERWAKNVIFAILCVVLGIYSIYLSFAGALTTASIPPKVEAEQLSQNIPYTFAYNFQRIRDNISSSLVYNWSFHSYMSVNTYHFLLTSVASGMFVIAYTTHLVKSFNTKK